MSCNFFSKPTLDRCAHTNLRGEEKRKAVRDVRQWLDDHPAISPRLRSALKALIPELRDSRQTDADFPPDAEWPED